MSDDNIGTPLSNTLHYNHIVQNFRNNYFLQAQRARGKLIREVRESFTVDAFVGSVTERDRVCMGNLVGLPVVVVPTGFTEISDPPSVRKTAVTTGIYAPPDRDHIVSFLSTYIQQTLRVLVLYPLINIFNCRLSH